MKKTKKYLWHFWVHGHKKADGFQVIIDSTNYSSARHRMKEEFPHKKWNFQFGMQAYENTIQNTTNKYIKAEKRILKQQALAIRCRSSITTAVQKHKENI